MIQSITVTNPLGESLNIELRNPEQSGFFVRGIEGLGPSKATINMTEVLSADGSFFNSSRIVSRNIVLDLGFYPNGSESIEDIRQKTYRFFPVKRKVTFEVLTDNRYGLIEGYVESNEPDIFSKEEGAQISIVCPSAFFQGDIIQTLFSGVNSMFEFPWENPSLTLSLIEFGQVYIDTQRSLVYTGDEDTGVVIYINILGGVGDLGIFNLTTGQDMSFSQAKVTALLGSNLLAGDQIVISTLKGEKYAYAVRSGIIYNLINALDANSEWFTIQRGDNVFTYTASVGLANIQMYIEHRVIYGGI